MNQNDETPRLDARRSLPELALLVLRLKLARLLLWLARTADRYTPGISAIHARANRLRYVRQTLL